MLGVEILQRMPVSLLTTELPPGAITSRVVSDAQGEAEEIHIVFPQLRDLVLSVRFRLYQHRPFVLFQLTLRNQGQEAVPIRRFFLQTLPNGLRPVATPSGFYSNGWQSWSPAGFLSVAERAYCPIPPIHWLRGPITHNTITPCHRKPSRFWSETVGAVVTPREALVAGAVSLADQFVQINVDLRPNISQLLLQSQVDEVLLKPGKTCTSEWFYLEWVALPNIDPLAQYAHATARQMQVPASGVGSLSHVPTGWCSWYAFGENVSQDAMIDNLATAALLADELPLEIIQLDEGYESRWGDWQERNEDFPHSLDWLAERIKGSDFTPGLWLAPFMVHGRAKLVRDHPVWLLRNAAGRPVSAGLILKRTRSARFMGHALDVTHPGVQAHLRQLVERVVHEWGYAYLKLDFLYAAALPGRHYDPTVTRAQAYRKALHIVHEVAGEETFLLGCGAPLGPSIGLVNAMRIGPDTASEWFPHFGRSGGWCPLRRLLRRNPSLPSMRNSLHNVMTRAWMHGRWWINDPDALIVRDTHGQPGSATSLTEDMMVAQATLLGLSSGMCLMSDDLSRLSPGRREIAAALLPPLIEGMDVLDLFSSERPEVVVAPVSRPWGHWHLLGLFNWEAKPVQRTLPQNLPGIDERQEYHLVDFWNRRYVRFDPEDGRLPRKARPSFVLPAHGGVLLSLRPVRQGPHLVATTFHISQGAEVTAWEAEASQVALSLSIGRLARGEVWLALPSRPTVVLWNEEALPESSIRAVVRGVWAIRFWLNRKGTLQVKY
jgi:alpha-galactosidase